MVETRSARKRPGKGSEKEEQTKDGTKEQPEKKSEEAPKKRTPKKKEVARPAAKKAGATPWWWASCVLTTMYGAFGIFFTFKEFFDPKFSEWLSLGPGQALLGDSGRLQALEAGPEGLRTKLLGCPAWALEGAMLGAGSLGVVFSWSTKPEHIELSAYLTSIEGIYYLGNIMYFYIVDLPLAIIPMICLGGPLLGLAAARVGWFLPRGPEHEDKYDGLLAWITLLACIAIILAGKMFAIYPDMQRDIDEFTHLRDYFLYENNMTWTSGLPHPDGYVPLPPNATAA